MLIKQLPYNGPCIHSNQVYSANADVPLPLASLIQTESHGKQPRAREAEHKETV
jgi:hypothetical protein